MSTDKPPPKKDKKPEPVYVTFSYYYGDLNSPDKQKRVVQVPDIDQMELEGEPKFHSLSIKALICLFNSALEELTVMKCIMNATPDDSCNKLIEYQDLHERYSKITEEFQIYSTNKNILRHLCTLYNIFYSGFYELVHYRGYASILRAVKDYIHLIHDEATLLDDLEENKQLLKQLKAAVGKEKRALQEVMIKRNYKLFKVKELVEEVREYTMMEFRYVTAWETSRLGLKNQELKDKEDFFFGTKRGMEVDTNSENRIHNEIERFTTERMSDLRTEIDFWMEQYDLESDTRDNELSNLRIQIEVQKDNLEQAKKDLEFRTEFIKERLQIREDRLIAKARARLEAWAALKIQAWWRGTMVRKFLGPYRKYRKKKGKKGGKGAAKKPKKKK